ncbi:hypothetical protein KKI24_04360 [bacterium]|nr:hypothetical protein [bacterium]
MDDKTRTLLSDISARHSGLNLVRGGSGLQLERLASCVDRVDEFLEGGLPFGSITEFGMPLGKEGRILALKFVVNATRGIRTKPLWTLWISSHETFRVFPPAWFARGVSPAWIVFAQSDRPLRDLKLAISNPIFKLIILDSPRKFTREECFFVSRQARQNRQLVMLLRDFFLSNRQGNIWASLRMNCWKRYPSGTLMIRVIRGLSRRELSISDAEMSPLYGTHAVVVPPGPIDNLFQSL